MSDTAEISIGQLQRDMLTQQAAARHRDGAPVLHLDNRLNRYQADLAALAEAGYDHTNPHAYRPPYGERIHALLTEAVIEFTKWADMPQAELASAVWRMNQSDVVPPTPKEIAHGIIARLTREGIEIRIDDTGKLRVSPGSKVDQGDRALIQTNRVGIMEELARRDDVWVVKNGP